MPREAPSFWWTNAGWQACVLAPVAAIYGAVARRRLVNAMPPKVGMPVLCIGNFTVGGAGKTPTAIVFAKSASARGLRPGVVTRGYGGSYSGLHLVDTFHDSASLTGDEPLLLARHATVVVSADRVAAAHHLASLGCDFIIMDDGFQSARLHVDFALLVVDAARGVGNGHVFPAGPLRAPLADQLHKADALLRIGAGHGADVVVDQAYKAEKRVYDASLRPSSRMPVVGQRFLAFAGIGNPAKFFDSVAEFGGEVAATRSFADHHAYTLDEINALVTEANENNLRLITTAKDQVRLLTTPGLPEAFLQELAVLDVDLVFGQPDSEASIIDITIERFRVRA